MRLDYVLRECEGNSQRCLKAKVPASECSEAAIIVGGVPGVKEMNSSVWSRGKIQEDRNSQMLKRKGIRIWSIEV